MYSLVFGNEFLSSVKKLENKLKRRINVSLKLLEQNPFSPKLHAKPLQGKLAGFYSCRIGRDYRIVFKFLDENTITLLKAAPRDKIYR